MGRMTTLLTLCLLMIVPRALPQQSAPQTPEDAYTSRELIAWSQLQQPQPTPQPLPPRDTPVPQPEAPPDQQPKLPANPQIQQQPTHSYIGKIIKDCDRYVLELADGASFQLDADDLQQFENQNAKVVITLDPAANSVRIVTVERALPGY